MKRTPLQRRTRLAPRSRKAADRDREYEQARSERRRLAGGWCEAATPACRSGAHVGQHAHHVRLRSQGGAHTAENLRWLCWSAHLWVHQNPAEAAERGLIERRS